MAVSVFSPLPVGAVLQGVGAVEQLPQVLDRLSVRRALLVTGRTLAERTDLVARLERLLGDRLAGVFAGISQHSPSSQVVQAAQEARRLGVSGLISLGGGSPIDATKAIAYALSRGVTTREQLLGQARAPVTQAVLPHVALPTTLSAAECSYHAGITDENARMKSTVGGPELAAAAVVYDPELAVHTPTWLWAATGMRAIDHAVESIYSPDHQPLTDLLAQQALRLLFAHLPTTAEAPRDLERRLLCQQAAWFSFFGACSVRVGLSHALGRRIGARFDVPHGYTSALVLPHVVRARVAEVPDRLRLVAEAVGVDSPELSDRQAAERAAQAVADLVVRLALPTHLREVGIQEADLPWIAEGRAEVIALLHEAL
ncbi:MAG: iron-containing alcohol dehydrogenase [Chloroflexi bacterium]|nr:iron-containing alcohol dehydrogenase [Chloroflexota bacterium]